MYTLTVDDNNLYIPEERDYSLNSAKIKINSDRVAYLDFEIPITNKAYGLLNEKTSMVKVYKDNVLTYKFFIDNIEDDFYYNKSVSCTSVVEYLSDSMVRPYSTIESEPGLLAPSSLDGYFQWLIDQHNAVCDTKKKFYVGVNQGASLDNNNYIYRASTQTPTVSSEIKDKILTPYPSAYITVSFDGEKNIINLYSDIYDKNDQIIDFGVNLLDFVKTADYSKCYTAVRPTGSTPESSEGNSSKLPITIESIPDGVSKWSSDVYKKQDVVYSISGVNKWGYRECAYSNSDIKTVDSLYQTSVVYLNKISSPSLTIEVKAVDLSLLMGDKYSPLKVGQAVRIRSAPHNIDMYMTVSSIDIDVLDPTNDLYTLGESYDSLTGQQSAYVTRLNASINSAVDVIGSASDAASKLAEAANKKAQEAKDKADIATDAATDATAKADTATNTANSAVNKAEEATTKADSAVNKANEAATKAEDATTKANEATAKANLVDKKAEEAKSAADSAKQAADEANTAAGNAQTSADNANQAATEAKNSADEANTAAANAQSTANSALSSAAQANKDVGNVKTQITEINKEMTSVKQDASTLRDDLTGKITTVKETMEADYAKKSELSSTESTLRTEISKSAAGIRAEVSQTYSTKKELETTTNAAATAQSTADAAKKAAESNAYDLANAVSKFNGDISGLKDQIDGAIQTWFYDGIPNALTEPEVNWTTDKDRQTHLGDLYYDNQTGFCYRYMNQNGVYSWGRIQDTEVTKALSDAANAQNTANAKKRIFVSIPTPPYDVGDLWVQGSTGDILRCQTPKIDSQAYSEADWVKASKYTDDTAVTNLSNTVERTYATKSTVNQLSDRIEQTVSSVEEVRTDASAANTAAANAKKSADNAASAAATAQSTASAAQTKATAAASAAATAQTAADEAKENATSAANAAAAAQSKANAAQTAADAAKANASAAQTAADAANADLVAAKKNLQDLQGRADATDTEIAAAKTAVSKAQTAADAANSAASKANTDAAKAQNTADTAKANAATAQSKANEAATAASTAQSTADTAKQNAATAQSKANEAASAASTAQSTADTAKANAKKAQDDVNALKNRVTSAETKITQNSEAIALRATKTEVMNGLAKKPDKKETLAVYTMPLVQNSSKYWLRLGTLVMTNSANASIIHVITGSGYNGSVSNNSEFWIMIKRNNGANTGKFFGLTVDLGVNCANVNVKAFASDDTHCNIWVYLPWSCPLGQYDIQGMYSEWIPNKSSDNQEETPAPSGQTEQEVAIRTIAPTSYVDAQLKITSDSITSTVSNVSSVANAAKSTADTVKNDLANLSVGGRNLARGTNMIVGADGIGWASNGHNPPKLVHIDGSWAIQVTRTNNSDKYLPSTALNNWVLLEWGNTYKYSAEIMIPEYFNTMGDNTPLNYWLDSSSTPDIINPNRSGTTAGISVSGFVQVYMLRNKWYRFEYTITTADTKPDEAYEYPMIRCFLYGHNNGTITGYTEAYIRNLKIEKGNKPTDWSPAPEDYSTTTEMQSSINQTAESIKSTVAATYVNNEALSSYATKSQLEQTSTSLTSRIQTTETTVSKMNTTVKHVDDYMTFARENDQPTLTIGSSSSSFRTKLTNTGEKFMQGDQTIMELDGITSTVKTSRVQMGHYQWRDTGTSMQLVYIPE